MVKHTAKKELEQDEFIEFSHRLVGWCSDNRNALLAVAIVLVVAITGVTVMRGIGERAHRERAEAFNAALESYGAALAATEADQRAEQMAATEKLFADFSRAHSGELGRFALYMQANTYFFRGVTEENYRRAAELFDRYASGSTTAGGRAAGYLAKGYALESLGFLANDPKVATDAIRAFEAAIKDGGTTWVAADALLGKARILAGTTGREQEALPILERLKKERSWTAPYEMLNDFNMTEAERAQLSKALMVLDEYGIARSAELLEARIAGRRVN